MNLAESASCKRAHSVYAENLDVKHKRHDSVGQLTAKGRKKASRGFEGASKGRGGFEGASKGASKGGRGRGASKEASKVLRRGRGRASKREGASKGRLRRGASKGRLGKVTF